jgi:hypothetical protein
VRSKIAASIRSKAGKPETQLADYHDLASGLLSAAGRALSR